MRKTLLIPESEIVETTITDKMKKVHDNGMKIYPKFDINFRFAVVVEDSMNILYKSKKTIGEYKHTTKSINNAIIKALEHVYDKLNKK